MRHCLARSWDLAQRERGSASRCTGGIALDHQRHPSRDAVDREMFLNKMFGGLHLLERAPVGDRQVGDHVLELAAEGWVVRELPMNRLGEYAKWSVILGLQPQDVFIEPVRAHEAVLERWHGRKDAAEPAQHSVVEVRGRCEWEEHGDVGRNPQPSIAVQPRTGLSNRWLGLRYFDDEATVQDRIHVDNLDRGDGLCIAFRGMRGVMRRHARRLLNRDCSMSAAAMITLSSSMSARCLSGCCPGDRSATGTRFTVDSCSSFVDDGAGGDGVGDMRIDT